MAKTRSLGSRRSRVRGAAPAGAAPERRARPHGEGHGCCPDSVDWHATLFRLLADANRLRIIYLLLEGPLLVGEIAARLGIEQSLVSHHLATLRRHDLVTASRSGRVVRYALPAEVAVALDGKTLDLGCCVVTFRRSGISGRAEPPRPARQARQARPRGQQGASGRGVPTVRDA